MTSAGVHSEGKAPLFRGQIALRGSALHDVSGSPTLSSRPLALVEMTVGWPAFNGPELETTDTVVGVL